MFGNYFYVLVGMFKLDGFSLLRCVSRHSLSGALEEWISTKDFRFEPSVGPKWHIPNNEELQFANELLNLHFESALDDLLKICQNKVHSDPGNNLKFFP